MPSRRLKTAHSAKRGRGGELDAAENQGALDFLDRLRDLDATRACIGAVEGGAAAPHTFLVVQHLEPLLEAGIATVEDEPVRGHDRCRTEVLTVRPVNRARSGARSAQDALCGVVEASAIVGRLQTLAGGLVAFGDQEGKDLSVGREERLHVDDHVLLEGQALDRLDGDRLADVQVLDQGLARKAVAPVDAHGIGSANAVTAGAAESQGAVEFALDLLQRGEDSIGGVERDRVVLPVRFFIELGDEPADPEGDVCGDWRVGLGDDYLLNDCCHQYLRSIGS